MITGLILPIICKKYNISCILFSKDYKIVEFTDNLKDFVSDTKKLFVDGDIRDSLWELVGFEEKLQELYNGKKNYLHIPMLLKKDVFYDINIETCKTEKNEKLFIAMFTRQSNLSMSYLNIIQKVNHENLKYEYEKENIENSQNYYNLINQKLISFHINQKGIITEVNKACLSFFGLEKSIMIGKHFSNFFFSREVKVSSTEVSNILRATNLNGIDVFFHTDIIPVKSEKNSSQNIIICQDITYLKKIESELEYAVNHDSLTGLPNRLMLRKRIEECILKSKDTKESFALCFIDLNKFKSVNDEYGHHVGDMLLKHIGEVLSSIIREGDIIARIGGDEFVILFDHIESTQYLDLTLKRIDSISKKNPLYYSEDLIIPLTFSLGVSIYPNDGEDIESLLNHADEKMYKEKKERV
ncbi:sensor domain-containing diguanylate cyclase [Arcobacter sp. L]|jgi:diguanylate cyclase (GGDEF)-like protein/PAS domain S-box-containing protein|uniref:sensor domain-containing diguanylate cyclase n=1 Tax=Arcobacter sp. L TaxID=944547 RepID=UPI000229659B|nr:sensor domain-containing diguanylate cyclase [Arcobacter sp. L]BAK73800.1 diguanylate cyclase/phosphodiesterase [Arcobacter sp. L]